MLVRKERKRKVHSLIDKVWNWKNLNEAWKKVKKNKGAAGIDKVTIDEFERNLEQNLNEIQRLLRQDKYEPMPVNRIYIPKSDGKQRPLGIPINVNKLYMRLDGWTRMRLRAFKEKKKSYRSNFRIRNDFLKNLGLKSLSTLLNPVR
jgi:hypothetical protein